MDRLCDPSAYFDILYHVSVQYYMNEPYRQKKKKSKGTSRIVGSLCRRRRR